MKEYDFDYPIKDYQGINNYRWDENVFGTRSLEYITGRFLWGFGLSGVTAGASWFVFAWLVPFENYQRIVIAVGGCLFCIGGFVAGWLIERYVRARGPLLILKSDKTIILHRLDKTIVPDSATHFELREPRDEWRQRHNISAVDLVLWHKNRTYYVATGGISLFGSKTQAPIEILYAELCEIYPFEGMELKRQKKAHDQAIESQRAYNRHFVLEAIWKLLFT